MIGARNFNAEIGGRVIVTDKSRPERYCFLESKTRKADLEPWHTGKSGGVKIARL